MENNTNDTDLNCISSGFKDIDNMLDCGFHQGDLIIIGVPKGVYRTMFVIKLINNIAIQQDIPVGIFSLELKNKQLIQHLLCYDSQLFVINTEINNIDTKHWIKLVEILDDITTCVEIFIDDSEENNITNICAKSKKLYDEVDNLRVIIVDYFQLIEKNEKYVHSQTSTIIKDLKALAKELNVLVILFLELPPAINHRTDKTPKLTDLSCFYTIKQYADTVMLLHSVEDNKKNEQDSKNTDTNEVITEFIAAESEYRIVGTVPLLFNKLTGDFRFEVNYDFPMQYIPDLQNRQDIEQLNIEVLTSRTENKENHKCTKYAWGNWVQNLRTDKIPKLECPNCKEISFTPTRIVGSYCTGNHTISGYCTNCGFEHTNLKNSEYYESLHKLLVNCKDKDEYIY